MSVGGERGCGARRGEKRLRAWERIFSTFEKVAGSVKRREGKELGARVPSPFFFLSHSKVLVAKKVQREEEE